MSSAIPLENWIALSFALFALGVYGIATKRNLIRIIISAEIASTGINIALVAFSTYNTPFTITGQTFAILLIAMAAIHTAMGLAMVMLYHTRYGTLDLTRFSLKG